MTKLVEVKAKCRELLRLTHRRTHSERHSWDPKQGLTLYPTGYITPFPSFCWCRLCPFLFLSIESLVYGRKILHMNVKLCLEFQFFHLSVILGNSIMLFEPQFAHQYPPSVFFSVLHLFPLHLPCSLPQSLSFFPYIFFILLNWKCYLENIKGTNFMYQIYIFHVSHHIIK